MGEEFRDPKPQALNPKLRSCLQTGGEKTSEDRGFEFGLRLQGACATRVFGLGLRTWDLEERLGDSQDVIRRTKASTSRLPELSLQEKKKLSLKAPMKGFRLSDLGLSGVGL